MDSSDTVGRSWRRTQSAAWRLGGGLALAIAIALGVVRPVSAEDAPPAPVPPAPLEALFLPLREALKDTPPFFRDTDLRAHFRTYYFDRTKPDGDKDQALATGGWVSYASGWLLDTFAMGATLYGSIPLYAPDDRDGTLLLRPGQDGYYVPGEAWGALRYKEYALLRGYRQLVDQAYINPQDNRMTPNTFEGVTLGGKVDFVQYFGGYLWKIKPRNADEFIYLSEQAGAAGTNDGAVLAGVRMTPLKNLRIDVANQYGINTFNTLYAEAEYRMPLPLGEGWALRLGAQFTDERSVGDQLVPAGPDRSWNTQVGGARVQLIWNDLTLTTAFSVTASGNTIQSPWGSYPGYLSLIDQDFNRAREKAWLIGAAYDFSDLLMKGLSANFNFAWGMDAINPATRAKAPNQAEYDFTVDIRPDWLRPSFLKGLWLRARAAVLDQEDAKRTGYQFRVILNWERDLL